MNIALLTHEPFSPPSGGGSAQAAYLARELVRRGHAVHVFAPQEGDAGEIGARLGLRIHPFRAYPMRRHGALRNAKYLAYPFFLERLVREAARETRFDALVAQHAIAAVAAGRLRRELGCPVAMNFLDHLTGFFESWPPYLAPPALVRRLKAFELGLPLRAGAEAVFTVSDELADLFAGTGYPRERIVPLHYGYDAELFRPTFRAAPAPLVVMHGSFDLHHLDSFAARVLEYVHRRRPDARFRFVGRHTEALRSLLQAVRDTVPADRIECPGFIPYDRVASHIDDATVGIVPYPESAGVHCAMTAKTVEYAAMGVPMVCTPLRGTMRYWKDDPIIRFSRPGDPADFADKVVSWFDEPPERRLAWGRAASERARRELDWPVLGARVAERLEALHAARAGAQG